jgi:kynureninase
MEAQLDTWSSIGVCGHFTDLEDSPLKQWQLLAEQAATSMARVVGAAPEEVAAMGTLTGNLHLLLASFYKPTETRRKILMDWKAFPSDHVSFAKLSSLDFRVTLANIFAVRNRVSHCLAWPRR